MDYLMPLVYMLAGAIVLGVGFFSAVYLLFDKQEVDNAVDSFFNVPTVEPTTTSKTKVVDDDTENKNTFYQ